MLAFPRFELVGGRRDRRRLQQNDDRAIAPYFNTFGTSLSGRPDCSGDVGLTKRSGTTAHFWLTFCKSAGFGRGS